MLNFNFNTNTLNKETSSLLCLRSEIIGLSFLLLSLITFYPQYSSAFLYTNNQMNSPLYGNFGSLASSSLFANHDSLYGSNFGSMYGGGGLGGLGMNNGLGGMMMPGFGSGYGYSTPSFGSGGLLNILSGLLGLGSSIFGGAGLGGLGMSNDFGGMMMPGFGSGYGYGSDYGYGMPGFGNLGGPGIGGGGSGGLLDVFSGLLGGLGSSPSFNQEGLGSDYNSDYEYESNYNNNNFDYTIQPNSRDLGSFGGYNSDYGSNSDFDYSNEFQSDLPLEDLRSFDSSMSEQQYSFQDDYDFSQIPIDDFSSSLFQ